MELLKRATGINAVPVHYKGGGASTLAIISGEVKEGFGAVPSLLPYVKAGKLKAYVVTSKQRFPARPTCPHRGAQKQDYPISNWNFGSGCLRLLERLLPWSPSSTAISPRSHANPRHAGDVALLRRARWRRCGDSRPVCGLYQQRIGQK